MSKIGLLTIISSILASFGSLTANPPPYQICEKGIFPEPGGTPKEAATPEWIEADLIPPVPSPPSPQPAPTPEAPKTEKDIFPPPTSK